MAHKQLSDIQKLKLKIKLGIRVILDQAKLAIFKKDTERDKLKNIVLQRI